MSHATILVNLFIYLFIFFPAALASSAIWYFHEEEGILVNLNRKQNNKNNRLKNTKIWKI